MKKSAAIAPPPSLAKSTLGVFRQLLFLLPLLAAPLTNRAQSATLLPARNLAKWGISAGNYSGIVSMGANRYAVVSDKGTTSGISYWHIEQDSLTGQVAKVEEIPFWDWERGAEEHVASSVLRHQEAPLGERQHRAPKPKRPVRYSKTVADSIAANHTDPEAIAYVPEWNMIFLAHERQQRIRSWETSAPTGIEMNIPRAFSPANIRPNRGFESLCYAPLLDRLIATTEAPLAADTAANNSYLRWQTFDEHGEACEQYLYRLDQPTPQTLRAPHALWGVSDICAMPTGELFVVERELSWGKHRFPARSTTKIYRIDTPLPTPFYDFRCGGEMPPIPRNPQEHTLKKQAVAQWETALNLWRRDFANTEAICPGITLPDGRRTLLLLNDSQNRAGNALIRLKDFIRVILLPTNPTATP